MIGTSLFLALGLTAMQPQTIRFEALEWMSGHWLDRGDFPRIGPRWSELFWTAPADWQMFGVGRTQDGFGRRSFEYLRLEQEDDGIVLHLSSDGGPAARYRLVRADDDEAVFENGQVEYPQRLAYRRDGDRLTVTRSRLDGSRELDRTFLPYDRAIRDAGDVAPGAAAGE